jgi:hypothetical protein
MNENLSNKVIPCEREDKHLRASPAVRGMRSCTVKLDEENPKYAGLAQENGFNSE